MQISKRFLENEIKTSHKENKHLMSNTMEFIDLDVFGRSAIMQGNLL